MMRPPLQQVRRTLGLTRQRVSSPQMAGLPILKPTAEYDWPWPTIPDSGAHNGISEGFDPAQRPYINFALNTIEGAIPAERRSPVFFTDVKPPPPDNFIKEHLGGNGWNYFDAFPEGWEDRFGTQRGRPLSDSEYWLLVNRASNGTGPLPFPTRVSLGKDID